MKLQVMTMNKRNRIPKIKGNSTVEQVNLQLLRAINSNISHINVERMDYTFVVQLQHMALEADAGFVVRLIEYCKEKLRPSAHALILLSALARKDSNIMKVCELIPEVIKSSEEIDDFITYYYVLEATKEEKQNRTLDYHILTSLNALSIKLQGLGTKDQDSAKCHTKELDNNSHQQKYSKETTRKKISHVRNWKKTISSNRLNYMELLKGLPHIIESNVDTKDMLNVLCRLGDRKEIIKADVTPFEIFTMYRMIESVDSVFSPSILKTLEKAMLISMVNLKDLKTLNESLVITDSTSDMYKFLPGTNISYIEQAVLFKNILLKGSYYHSKLAANQLSDGNHELGFVKDLNIDVEDKGVHQFFSCIEHIWNLVVRRVIAKNVLVFTCDRNWSKVTSLKYISIIWKRYRLLVPDARLFIINMDSGNSISLQKYNDEVNYISGFNRSFFELIKDDNPKVCEKSLVEDIMT